MMTQITRQLQASKTVGEACCQRQLNLSDQINEILSENQNLKLANVIAVPLTKVGGIQNDFLCIFEAKDAPLTERQQLMSIRTSTPASDDGPVSYAGAKVTGPDPRD